MNRGSENGQGLVEYALILILITFVVIVALELFGVSVSDLFIDVNSALDLV